MRLLPLALLACGQSSLLCSSDGIAPAAVTDVDGAFVEHDEPAFPTFHIQLGELEDGGTITCPDDDVGSQSARSTARLQLDPDGELDGELDYRRSRSQFGGGIEETFAIRVEPWLPTPPRRDLLEANGADACLTPYTLRVELLPERLITAACDLPAPDGSQYTQVMSAPIRLRRGR